MRRIALKMLLGDRAKYLGLVFGVTFATLLMAQQVSGMGTYEQLGAIVNSLPIPL